MPIDWQQVRRLLVIFLGDIETELTFLQAALQGIRERSSGAEITLLVSFASSLRTAVETAATQTKSAGADFERKAAIRPFAKVNFLTVGAKHSGDKTQARSRFLNPNALPANDSCQRCIEPDLMLVDRLISHTTTWQDPTQEKALVEKLVQHGRNNRSVRKLSSPYHLIILTFDF